MFWNSCVVFWVVFCSTPLYTTTIICLSYPDWHTFLLSSPMKNSSFLMLRSISDLLKPLPLYQLILMFDCLRYVCQDFQNRLQVASQKVSAAHDSSEVFLCRELMEFFSDVLPLSSPNWHLFYWVMLILCVCVFVGHRHSLLFFISIFFEGKKVVFW